MCTQKREQLSKPPTDESNNHICSEILFIKKSKTVSFLCLIFLMLIYIVGCYICIRMGNNQYAASMRVCFNKLPSPFTMLNLFMCLGSGICAFLFSPFTPAENRYVRWLSWGGIQGIGTWMLAFSIAVARHCGDGIEGIIQFWGPQIISSVFLGGVLLYSASKPPILFQVAYKLRKLCLLFLIIGLMVIILTTF